jgi:hypothetical protein
LFDATYPATVLEKDNVQAMARNLSLKDELYKTRRPEDIAPAFDALKGHTDALYVVQILPMARASLRSHSTYGYQPPSNMHG